MRTFTRPFAIAFLLFSSLWEFIDCSKFGWDVAPTPGETKGKMLPAQKKVTWTLPTDRDRWIRKGALVDGKPFILSGKDTIPLVPANFTLTKFVSDQPSFLSATARTKGKNVFFRLLKSEEYETTDPIRQNTSSSETWTGSNTKPFTDAATSFISYDMKLGKQGKVPNGYPIWVSQETTPGSGQYVEVFLNNAQSTWVVSVATDVTFGADGVPTKHTVIGGAIWVADEIVDGATPAGGRLAAKASNRVFKEKDLDPLAK